MNFSARFHYPPEGKPTGPAVFKSLESALQFHHRYLKNKDGSKNPIFFSIEDDDKNIVCIPLFWE